MNPQFVRGATPDRAGADSSKSDKKSRRVQSNRRFVQTKAPDRWGAEPLFLTVEAVAYELISIGKGMSGILVFVSLLPLHSTTAPT
jgi:hypothetical protein